MQVIDRMRLSHLRDSQVYENRQLIDNIETTGLITDCL